MGYSRQDFFKQKKSWSYFKDEILRNYLKPYITKITKNKNPLIIIDCFAGKGKFDDGSDGSPIIIMETIKNFIESNEFSRIKAIFIENKYYKDLRINLEGYTNYNIFKGTFEENIEKISSLDPNNNLFIYIDPYGIKSLDFSYFTKIVDRKFSSLEILLNFNSIGFLREACRVLKYFDLIKAEEVEEDYEVDDLLDFTKMCSIANGGYWIQIINSFKDKQINFYEAEEKFVNNYIDKLNSLFEYLIKIPIKTKIRNIPKYRIIFATYHPDGLILMADNMNRTWNKIVEKDRKGQKTLFEYDLYSYDVEKNIEEKIIDLLNKYNKNIDLKELHVKLIKYFGFKFSFKDYRSKIKELEKDGLIEIKRRPEFTKTGKLNRSFDYNKNEIIIIFKNKNEK